MRPIDADALKKQWSMADKCEDCPQDARRCQFEQDFTRMDICEMIDEAPTIGGWISVEDKMPAIAETVLFTGLNAYENRFIQKGYYNGGVWIVDCIGRVSETVTHWMPLPEPPKEGNHGTTD